ncbi:decaprenyl-phosphate phosphoribosyltransferase [Geosporobacter ferrireducens]|uniref:Phosphoribose diphosphate--decaprenyl-phosphate phosphoribosyltransferase n=1 Tax=Geosporobacter ferrireducens TaxID=1424294 RepID=A0A1D8GGW7_9FIRM|nr:decaprenyl-phosphate phosphoribosyltransferase [Geosporobacter ferrireducens]AOT70150.1 phosphoribose diphosphate--decaprenyl-phosphate phosphoribosyltransferase [Geosporobacter ferrireducens]
MENLSAKLRYTNVVNTIKSLIRIMRPKQWTKNLIVFAALLFSDNLFNMELLKLSVSGFFLFCMFSGSVYVINDIVDIEKDRKHPKKCKRPLPSGHISVKQAIGFVIIIFTLTVLASYRFNPLFAAIGIAYFILVTFYSFYLKNVVILDVMTIALGFVLRAVGGTVLIHVKISPWLLLCTILLSMFLALHKRKSELELVANGNKGSRKILEDYTPELINDMLHIVTSSTVMAYSLYTFTGTHSIYMMGTIPFVIYGIFRYQYIAHTKDMGENPELILLNDIPLIVNILLWVVSCVVILYWL